MSQDEILIWAEKLSAFLAEEYPIMRDTPPLFETLTPSGILLIRRKLIESTQFRSYYSDEHRALMADLAIPKPDRALASALKEGSLRPALAILILKSRCTNCGQSYQECSCSKVLDEGVAQVITDARMAFPFWTDRPAWK